MWNELIEQLSWNEKIKVLRVIRGLSQEEAAKQCMTDQKAWWNWESGKNYPSKIYRHTIARVLGVTVEDIFNEKGD